MAARKVSDHPDKVTFHTEGPRPEILEETQGERRVV
jgi:hypothetical protein